MKITKATRRFEAWLGEHLRLIQSDLELKHELMARDSLTFLRGTFYRWIQTWPDICPNLARAPEVLAVGDLHVENFGTWRDAEGRLVWGVNDFDETYPLPYTNDLVRLAVSANLAITSSRLKISSARACKAILDGYVTGLRAGGRPFILEEHHAVLRKAATSDLRDPAKFWAKMDGLPTVRDVPNKVTKALVSMLPEGGLRYRVTHRIAGAGSLGRQRFVALAEWRGGRIAREAKALAPSAGEWASERKASDRILYEEILDTACRAADPLVELRGIWLLRRLAPDCSRIELSMLPSKVDERRLLEAMGFETANIHSGSRNALSVVRRDVARRAPDWLHASMKKMTDSVFQDYSDWRSAQS
jgi:hypothetical protein